MIKHHKNILVIDPISYDKHQTFVNYYIDCLEELEGNVDLISGSNFLKKKKKILLLPEFIIKYKNRFDFVIKQIIIQIICFSYIYFRKGKYDKIIFTGFENYSVFFISRFFKKNLNINLIVHNNFKNKKIVKYFISKISSKFNLIIFEREFLHFTNLDNFRILNHFIPEIKLNNKSNYIFCHFTKKPSKKILNELVKYSKSKSLKLKSNSIFIKEENHFEFINHFDDFQLMLSKAKLIFIDLSYDFRLSGVLFESLGTNSKIVVNTSNDFNFELLKSKRFINRVYLFEKTFEKTFNQKRNNTPVDNRLHILEQLDLILNE